MNQKKRKHASKDQILSNLEFLLFNMPYFISYQIRKRKWKKEEAKARALVS